MIIINNSIDLNQLAEEIGVENKHLKTLFEALKREYDHLFPRIEEALSVLNLSTLHENTHALKGILGNLRLDDLYEIVTEMDTAARTGDNSYPYTDQIALIKRELTKIFSDTFGIC